MFLITVKGEIIANDKNHYAQDWCCMNISEPITDTSYDYDDLKRTIKNNLILNKSIRAVPYALYLSERGISTKSTGNIICAPGANAAECCYKDNISEIQGLLNVTIPSEIEVYFYHGLLIGIFSVLELFLSDVLLCLIFTNRDVYIRALDYMIKEKEKNTGKKYHVSDTDLEIQRFFTKGIVYHKFDQIKSIFKDILQITLPNTEPFRLYLHKRNNIAHRFAFSNINRMQMTVIDLDILKEFILCCNTFVERIMEEINRKY